MTSALDIRLAIVELHETSRMPLEVTAGSYVEPLSAAGYSVNAKRVGLALRALGFDMVSKQRARLCRCRTSKCDYPLDKRCLTPRKRADGKPRKSHAVITSPPVWRKPLAWSTEVHAQRRLSRSHHLKSNQVARASDVSFHNGELLDKAIEKALTERKGSLDHRGLLKAAISDVVNDLWQDAIPRRELADWLGEDPKVMNRAGLEQRARGLVRAAARSRT